MSKEERTIKIEQFLDGELTGQDLKDFKLKLQTDYDLAKECKLQKDIRNTLSEKELNLFRDKIAESGEKYEKRKEVKKKIVVALYSFFTIVIITISSYFIFHKTYSNNELFDKYYTHYDAGTVTRGQEQSTKDVFELALRKYDNSQYELAIELFDEISDTSSYSINKEYFVGLSYMELKKYKEAITHFTKVTDDEPCIYNDYAIWYKGLCYIKTKQPKEAVMQFKILKNKDSFYKKQATDVLEDLELYK